MLKMCGFGGVGLTMRLERQVYSLRISTKLLMSRLQPIRPQQQPVAKQPTKLTAIIQFRYDPNRLPNHYKRDRTVDNRVCLTVASNGDRTVDNRVTNPDMG